MSLAEPVEGLKRPLPSVWLTRGWRDFRASKLLSVSYALFFVVPGLMTQFWLVSRGYGLVYYIFATGFLLITPFVLSGYYRVAEIMQQDGRADFTDILASIVENPFPVWVIGMITFAAYSIWVVQALIIYGLLFDFDPVVGLVSDAEVRDRTVRFLFYTGLLALPLSLLTFALSIFSVPHAVCSGAGLVSAIVFSLAAVFRHLPLMIVWAIIVGALLLIALLFLPPLALILMPLFVYANFASYQDMLAEVQLTHHLS